MGQDVEQLQEELKEIELQLEALQKQKEFLQLQIQELAKSKGKACPVCGFTGLAENARFCENCGARLEEEQEKQEDFLEEAQDSPQTETCPFCGETLKPGTRFCVSCGRVVREWKV